MEDISLLAALVGDPVDPRKRSEAQVTTVLAQSATLTEGVNLDEGACIPAVDGDRRSHPLLPVAPGLNHHVCHLRVPIKGEDVD